MVAVDARLGQSVEAGRQSRARRLRWRWLAWRRRRGRPCSRSAPDRSERRRRAERRSTLTGGARPPSRESCCAPAPAALRRDGALGAPEGRPTPGAVKQDGGAERPAAPRPSSRRLRRREPAARQGLLSERIRACAFHAPGRGPRPRPAKVALRSPPGGARIPTRGECLRPRRRAHEGRFAPSIYVALGRRAPRGCCRAAGANVSRLRSEASFSVLSGRALRRSLSGSRTHRPEPAGDSAATRRFTLRRSLSATSRRSVDSASTWRAGCRRADEEGRHPLPQGHIAREAYRALAVIWMLRGCRAAA